MSEANSADDLMKKITNAQEEIRKCSMELQDMGVCVNGYTMSICDEALQSTLIVLGMYSEKILDMMQRKKQFRIETIYNPENGRLESNFYEVQP